MLNEEKKRKELRQSRKKLSLKKEGKILIGATKVWKISSKIIVARS
jgi:hypothetical protein